MIIPELSCIEDLCRRLLFQLTIPKLKVFPHLYGRVSEMLLTAQVDNEFTGRREQVRSVLVIVAVQDVCPGFIVRARYDFGCIPPRVADGILISIRSAGGC